MSKVWGYIRVSAKDQHEDRQVAELLPLVSSKSHLIIEKQSGKNFERPKYQWLKDIMDKGDTLVIKSLDRLGRNYAQIKEEWHELVKQGIYIKVLDSPILDTSEYKDNDLMAQFISNVVLEVLSFVSENDTIPLYVDIKEAFFCLLTIKETIRQVLVFYPESGKYSA